MLLYPHHKFSCKKGHCVHICLSIVLCIRIYIVPCVRLSRGVLQARYSAHTIDPSEWLKAIHIKLSVCSFVFLSFYLFSILHSMYTSQPRPYPAANAYGWAIRWKWFLKRIFENRFKCHMFFGSSCGRKKTCGAENCLGVCWQITNECGTRKTQ